MSVEKNINSGTGEPTRKQRAVAELKQRAKVVAILFGSALLFAAAAFLVLRSSKDDGSGNREPEGYLNGYRYVDLGLSVKWAEVSVGAEADSLAGDLYAWGEIESKGEFTIDNYDAPSEKMHNIERKRHHDVVTNSFGRGWRMPTRREVEELVDRCTWEPVETEGRCGYSVTGPNGNSIFIAADTIIPGAKPSVALWSSYVVTEDKSMAYAIMINDSLSGVVPTPTYIGLQVRGVTK